MVGLDRRPFDGTGHEQTSVREVSVMARNVAVLVGSLRKESFNRKMARVLAELAPDSLHLQIVEIGQLSLFNQDEEADPPAAYVDFRQRIKAADAVLFVTPEYNRS